MKIKRINAYNAGLVFRNGALKKVLQPGLYWLSILDEVYVYDLTMQFTPAYDLDILLKNEQLAALLEIIIIRDNEMGFQFENGMIKAVLTVGRYAFWKGVTERKFIVADMDDFRIPEGISDAILLRKEVATYLRGSAVESWEKGLLMVNGKLDKVLEPGNYFFWKNNTVISVLKADMRQMQIEISGQEILTRDKANLRLNIFAQYKVKDAVKALVENREFDKQVYVLLQLKVREFIGKLSMDELLERKDNVSDSVIEGLSAEANALGVELLNVGIKDVILPGEMKDIMNQVLIAEKKAQANTIMRREETASTRSLLNTAKLMEDNQMLFRLKEMEYVERIAEKINNISLSGGSLMVDQLKQIFVPEKK